jgi:Cu/Ag efflux protein CusF
MRRVSVVLSCLAIVGALSGGAVWAAEQLKATPCVAVAPSDLSHLAPDQEYPLAAGRIVALDSKAGTVTIAHQPIQHFYLQAETRTFDVADPNALAGFTAGDKVRFGLERTGTKKFVVTRIENSL